jgi:hypothetical protein
MNRGIALGLGLPVLLAATAPPAPTTCPMIGATYASRPAVADRSLTYRLKVEALPRTAGGAALATLWRFQTLKGGRQVSELRMHYSCPNGSGLCSITTPNGREEGRSSDVVPLNRDFSPTIGDDAPAALVLPGFQTANWTFADLAAPDLTLARGETEGPDLSGQISWVRVACGRR